MKRHIARAASLLLALASVTSPAIAQNSVRWAEVDLKFSTVNASTTNGITPRDSVFLQKNSAGTFNGTGENASGYADTTAWFGEQFFDPAMDITGFRSGVLSGADTTFWGHLLLIQEPGSSITASIDTVNVTLQGSYNGSTVSSATAFDLLDASSGEMVQRAFFTQVNVNNPSAIGLSTLSAFPYKRFILKGDYGGKLRLKLRYLTRDP